MNTKKEVVRIVHDMLNKRKEGITHFILHKIIKQTDNFLMVEVSYHWYLNGHEKPVSHIDASFYKENNVWRVLA